jgi:hypothetical protein
MVVGWEFDDMIQFGITASSLPSGVPGAVFAVGDDSVKARAWYWAGSFFGAKYTDPSTAALKDSYAIDITSANDNVAIGMQYSNYLIAFPFNLSTGWGAKYADPATLPSLGATRIKFNPSASAVAVTGAQVPKVWAWSGSGFGSQFSDPSSLGLIDNTQDVAFSPANDAIVAVGTSSSSSYIAAWAWSGSGFGAIKSNPSSPPTALTRSVAFVNDGSAVAVGFDASPFIHVYAWSGGAFGAKFSNPSTLLTSAPMAIEFNPARTAVAVGQIASPYLGAYEWSGSGFGAKYANPSNVPTDFVRSISFNSTGEWLATSNSSTNYLTVYQFSAATGFGGVRRPPLAQQVLTRGTVFTK